MRFRSWFKLMARVRYHSHQRIVPASGPFWDASEIRKGGAVLIVCQITIFTKAPFFHSKIKTFKTSRRLQVTQTLPNDIFNEKKSRPRGPDESRQGGAAAWFYPCGVGSDGWPIIIIIAAAGKAPRAPQAPSEPETVRVLPARAGTVKPGSAALLAHHPGHDHPCAGMGGFKYSATTRAGRRLQRPRLLDSRCQINSHHAVAVRAA